MEQSATLVQAIEPPSRVPVTALASPTVVPLALSPAAWIGHDIDDFRIVRVLGAGGMGVVFLAQQRHPQRLVAVKTLHAGISQPEHLARFQQEAEILARFTHPGIAQVIASGRTSTEMGAVPYIAMEYVQGTPLLEFCATQSVRERLELLRRICDAVEHAHIRGVIHRDLKPGNILVLEGGQPKVLDFGVARLAADRGGDELTGVGVIVGTVAYMSPEQASGDPTTVDIRTDVYALGMIGFRMLTGQLPYAVSGLNLAQVLKAICDAQPRALASFERRFAGDLDTIFAKSLAKEKDQRYRNAAEFSEDLRRYLADEAIIARKASLTAELRRFARRNRAVVVAASMVVFALIGAALISTSFALREQAQRREADAVIEFMNGLLSSANPVFAKGRAVTVHDVLGDANAALERDLRAAPAARARLRATLAETWRALGDTPRAAEYFAQAAADFNMAGIGGARLQLTEFGKARALLEGGRALEARDELEKLLLNRSASTAVRLHIQAAHARSLSELGSAEAALAEFRTTLAAIPKAGACEECEADWAPRLQAYLLINIARGERDAKRPHLALEAANEAFDIAKAAFGDVDPDTISAQVERSSALFDSGEREASLALAKSTFEGLSQLLGASHWLTLSAANNLALRHERMDELNLALSRLESAYALGQAHLEPDHPTLTMLEENYARLLHLTGDLMAAVPKLESAYRKRVVQQGETHPETLQSAMNLSVLYSLTGRNPEALSLLKKALAGTEARFGDQHRSTLIARSEYASSLRNNDRYSEADAEFRVALDVAQSLLPPGDSDRLRVLYQYAGSLQRQERFVDAEKLSRQLLDEAAVSTKGSQFALLAPLRHARSLRGLRRYAEAEALLVELESRIGSDQPVQIRNMVKADLDALRADSRKY